MKKDIFNDYILESKKKYVKGMLIVTPIIFLVLAGMLIFFAVVYGEQMQPSVKNFLCILSVVTIVYGILYPILTLLCIRNYPKCKKIISLFISDDDIFKYKEK